MNFDLNSVVTMETEILKKKLVEIKDTLFELEQLKTEIKFISDQEQEYFEIAVKKSRFFYRVYKNSIKLFVIDVCKLLNPKEHFSLIKTLDYIISNYKRINWNREISISEIRHLKQNLEDFNSEQLTNFKNLRDKHYVHNDKDKFEFESTIVLINCWKSLELLQKIYNVLSVRLSNQQFIFSVPGNKPREVISITRYRKIKKYILKELRKNPNLGNLQEVRNIILGKST